jgi:hypothetical protein
MKRPKKHSEIEIALPTGWHWCLRFNCRMHPAACGIHLADDKGCLKHCEYKRKKEEK